MSTKMPIHVPQATARGYLEVFPGGEFDYAYPNSPYRRGRVQDGGRVTPALTSSGELLLYYEGIYDETDSRLHTQR